jgi:hypothetical protein
MFLPTWPSAINATMFEISGRELSTYRIIKINEIEFLHKIAIIDKVML